MALKYGGPVMHLIRIKSLVKSSEGREIKQGERVVKDLFYKFSNIRQNVTMNNFFTNGWKLLMVAK